MWKKSTAVILGAALLVGAMSVMPSHSAAESQLVGNCALKVDVFTLDELAPEPDDLRYQVAAFLSDVTPDQLTAPTKDLPVGTALSADDFFQGASLIEARGAQWNFRRPLPWPSDPDNFELPPLQSYFLYRPAEESAFVSLALAGLPTDSETLSLPAFFGHISETRFFAAEPAGDITTCFFNPTTVFDEVGALLTQEIAAQSPLLEEISNG